MVDEVGDVEGFIESLSERRECQTQEQGPTQTRRWYLQAARISQGSHRFKSSRSRHTRSQENRSEGKAGSPSAFLDHITHCFVWDFDR